MSVDKEKLPPSWETIPLEDVVNVNPKIDKSIFDNELPVSFVPMPAVEAETGNINISEIKTFGSVKKGYTAFQEHDVLFAKITPCMENGKMAVVPKLKNGLGFGSTEFHVLRSYSGVLPEYIYYYVSSKTFRVDSAHNMTGAVGQRRVPATWLGRVNIPLPFIKEQYRIVAKIEELFSELDKGIESLKTAREQLKVYRQALLKHAFEGKLTEQWRKDNTNKLESADVLLARIQQERETRYQQQLEDWKATAKQWEDKGKEGKKPSKPRIFGTPEVISAEGLLNLSLLPLDWKWCKVGQVFDVYVGATPSRKSYEYWGGSVNWVSSGEVSFCKIRKTNEQITFEGLSNSSTVVHPIGTVMLAMIGEGKTRGQAAILNIEAAHNQNTAAIRVSETECSPHLFYYYLLYQYELTRKLGSGNNQKALNKERVSNMLYPLISIEEQYILVNIIEESLTVIATIEKGISDNLQHSEALRQSILKKAFSGQLVPQDPNDEPASVLLGRINAEKMTQAQTRPSSRKKKKMVSS